MLPHLGYRSRAKSGQTVCGDACAVWLEVDHIVLAVVDGLGHGPEAASAAQAALRCIGSMRYRSCEDIFTECDKQLYATRGVAMALAIVDPVLHQLTLATVGNIRAVLLTGKRERHLGGARGVVGAGFDGLAPERIELVADDTLLLYSDGLDEFLPWRDIQLPDFAAPAIAEFALDHWAKDGDDAAMLVYRHAGACR